MDGGAWWAVVHGVAKSQTRLSNFTFTFHVHALEKEMTTHSSVLAWRIPGTGEPNGLPSMGSHRFGHDWSDLTAAGERMGTISGWNIDSHCSYQDSLLKKKKYFSISCIPLVNFQNPKTVCFLMILSNFVTFIGRKNSLSSSFLEAPPSMEEILDSPWHRMFYKKGGLLLLLLSCFNRVRLCATP